jgi:hypothetical protein
LEKSQDDGRKLVEIKYHQVYHRQGENQADISQKDAIALSAGQD